MSLGATKAVGSSGEDVIHVFPNAPQKGSRFKVGVQESRRRSKVVAFLSASVASVAPFWESKIVAKRRTVSSFTFSLPKLSTVTGIGRGRGPETQNCRHFWVCLLSLRAKSVNSHRDREGSWSRNADLSSLLGLPLVVACQKCQQAQRSADSWSRTQNCRHFWTRVASSRLKSANRHRDRGVRGRERRTVVTFGLASCRRVPDV